MTERYLLEVYRYIELNPVRAEMVTDPGEYRWSGYQINALGKVSNLCTPHPEYLALGLERRKNYRALFIHRVDRELFKPYFCRRALGRRTPFEFPMGISLISLTRVCCSTEITSQNCLGHRGLA